MTGTRYEEGSSQGIDITLLRLGGESGVPEIGSLETLIKHIWVTQTHVSAIFPEDTDETVTVTAGGTNNAFGAWAELVDNLAVTLSSKFADAPGHIVSINLEDASLKDVRYLLEIAYGDAKTMVCRTRFVKVNVKVDVNHQARIRSIEIPAGETIYYRMKCETADATAEIHLRYFLE